MIFSILCATLPRQLMKGKLTDVINRTDIREEKKEIFGLQWRMFFFFFFFFFCFFFFFFLFSLFSLLTRTRITTYLSCQKVYNALVYLLEIF